MPGTAAFPALPGEPEIWHVAHVMPHINEALDRMLQLSPVICGEELRSAINCHIPHASHFTESTKIKAATNEALSIKIHAELHNLSNEHFNCTWFILRCTTPSLSAPGRVTRSNHPSLRTAPPKTEFERLLQTCLICCVSSMDSFESAQYVVI